MNRLYEALERRRMLSASLDPTTGQLTVTGTNQDDAITVALSGSQIVVGINGVLSNFAAAQVKQILVQALDGNDSIMMSGALAVPATLDGGAGNDTIQAAGGDDSLIGGAGNDVLIGGSGTDILDGTAGAGDTFTGGSGTDYMFGSPGNDLMMGGSGQANVMLGMAGDDTIIGGSGGGDNLNGGDGNDSLVGGSGAETLIGGAGDDTIAGGTGNQYIEGDQGNDVLYGGHGSDSISGGAGDDSIFGGTGADTLDGGDGNDYIIAGSGNDLMTGDAGDDLLVGGAGNDTMDGGDGNDTLVAGTGNNQMSGGLGDDLLFSGPGNNIMDGDAGNDTFVNGAAGHDTIDGGPGFDAYEVNPNDVILNCELQYNPVPTVAPAPVKPRRPPLGGATTTARLATAASPPHVAPNVDLQAAATSGPSVGRLTPMAGTVNPYLFALGLPVGAAPSVSIQNGLLVVLGTVGSDSITAYQQGSNLFAQINGRTYGPYAAAAVPNGVFINGGPGNDNVAAIGGLGNVTSFVFINAGTPGTDTLVGGAAYSYFYMGGAPIGPKTIAGYGSTTALDFSARTVGCRIAMDGSPSGQSGENIKISVPGPAVVYGSQGNDTIYGNSNTANNNLFGNGGNDTIYGGAGPINAITGGPGVDSIYGGPGINTVYALDSTADVFNTGGNLRDVLVADHGLDYNLVTHARY